MRSRCEYCGKEFYCRIGRKYCCEHHRKLLILKNKSTKEVKQNV